MESFEIWYHKNKAILNNNEVNGLFKDAIDCYHANISRQAYLLSYQAMMVYFKYVILSGTRPNTITENIWAGYLAKLRSDSEWDEMAFKATQQKDEPATSKHAILNIPNEIRPQFLYWRSIRNDCAHYKGNHIIKAHVQALWSFIEQYLLTFTIEGGIETLVKEFADFFNPAITAPESDITPLLDKIPSRIKDDDYATFFEGIRIAISRYTYGGFIPFIKHILDRNEQNVRNNLISYIQKKGFEEDIITLYPEYVIDIYTEESKIRQLWYSRLKYMANSWRIFAILLLSNKQTDILKMKIKSK